MKDNLLQEEFKALKAIIPLIKEWQEEYMEMKQLADMKYGHDKNLDKIPEYAAVLKKINDTQRAIEIIKNLKE